MVPFLASHIQNSSYSTCFLITLGECRKCFNPAVIHNVCSRASRLVNTTNKQLFSGLLPPGLNRDETTFSFFFFFFPVFQNGHRGTLEVEGFSYKDGGNSLLMCRARPLRGNIFICRRGGRGASSLPTHHVPPPNLTFMSVFFALKLVRGSPMNGNVH